MFKSYVGCLEMARRSSKGTRRRRVLFCILWPNMAASDESEGGVTFLASQICYLEFVGARGGRERNFRRVSMVADGKLLFGHRSCEGGEVVVPMF